MSSSEQFRKMLNLIESVSKPIEDSVLQERKLRKDGGGKGPVRATSDINTDPIPYADRASKNKGEDWMRKAVGIDDEQSERVFLDPENPKENRRIPMLVTFDPKENVWIYVPDNGARTMGDVNARTIERNLTSMGMKNGVDFKIDRFHGILKIAGKERRI